MKIKKQQVQASVDNIIYFQCPACQTKALVDVDNEVRSLLDVDYQDRFVCDECGEEFLGEVGYDLKPKFTKIADNVESATNTCGIAARPDQLKKLEDEVVSAATPPYRKREIVKSLQDKLINRCAKWFRDDFGHMDDSELTEFLPELGYNDINDMFVVEVTLEDDGRIRAEVRAELSYDGLYDLGEACNPIVQKYDKEAYFDMDQPGIMSAYLDPDSVYGSITNKINFGSEKHKQSDPQSEYEYRKNVYLKRKHEFETLGEDDNNDVLSREEKMNIAKAEMDKVNPKSVKSAKDATFKNDKRLSTTSERYKGYLIVLDRGGDGYNVYDKHRELEDAGYPSKEAAKNFIDELVANDDVYSADAVDDIESEFQRIDRSGTDESDAGYVYPPSNDYINSATGANYGGAYDIDPESYFTREDLDELGYSVAELVSLDLGDTVEYAGAWIEPNNELTVELKSTDYDSSVTLKVDMRKIRRPQDLTAKYAQRVADESIKQFKDWYQDEEAINSSEAIDAQYRSWYEPDDDDYIDVDEVEDVVEIDLDGTQVRISPDRSDDFVDKKHEWAEDVDIEIPDFSTWITVPPYQVEDDVWDMITDMLPEPTNEEKVYTLYGEVRLCYRVSNVIAEELDPIREPEGDYGYNYETYTDDAEIEFIRDKSQVVSLRVE